MRRAEADPDAPGARYQLNRVVWVRSLLLESSGRIDEAVELLFNAWDTCERHGVLAELPVLGPDLARLALRTGRRADRERAEHAARTLDTLAARTPVAAWLNGAALVVRGAAVDDVETLLHAVEVYRAGPRPLEKAQACEDAAGALLRRGEVDRARSLLVEAHGVYEQLQASRDLRRIWSAMRAAGVRRGPAGRRHRPRTGWEALTETELVIVRLVAERLSNPEIAERLFLSRRTVQTHVSHALAKLNLTSRLELAAEAQRHGWRLRLERVPDHSA